MSRLMRLPSGLLIPASSFLRRAQPTLIWKAKTSSYIAKGAGSLTLSGNEITDVIRAAAVEGDGRAVDDSMGIWEAATNLHPFGGFETLSDGWSASDAGTITRVSADAKFGSWCLEVNTTDATDGALFNHWTNPLTATQGVTYVTSVWLKAKAGGDVGKTVILLVFTSGGDVEIFGHDCVLTADWKRYALAVTYANAGHTKAVMTCRDNSGQGGFDFYLDGVQYEEQPIATPYIDTDGAGATRSAARVRMPASLIDETQGWFAARVRLNWANTDDPSGDPVVFQWADDANNFLELRYDTVNDQWEFQRRDGGGTAEVAVADTFSKGDIVTLIARWEAGTLYVSVDGAAFASQAGGNVPTLTAGDFDIGSSAGSAEHIDGDVLWVACGTGTLTDGDAAYMHNRWQVNVPSTLRRLLEAV